MNLFLVSLNMLDTFRIDTAVVIYSVLHINFDKIYTDSEIVLSMTLLFCRMFSFDKRFH